jgi:hypothetical protein
VIPSVTEPSPESQGENPKTVSKPGYHLQQAGSLILLTPKPFVLKKLKPAGSKLLTDDANFRAARNRFNFEPIFVFVNMKLVARQEEEQRKRYQAQREEFEKQTAEAAAKKSEGAEPVEPAQEENVATFIPERQTSLVVGSSEPPKEIPTPDPVAMALSTIGASFFEGPSMWPDGIGLALSLENDSFDLRALFVNDPGEKSDVVPFMPRLIPGSPIIPESPNILPADTELLVTLSLDLPQIYSAMSKPRPNAVYTSRGPLQPVNEAVHESPFAALEKRLKLNVKDDVLPLLGSEVAVRLPMTGLGILGLMGGPSPVMRGGGGGGSQAAGSSPVLLISLRDKEGARALMPKIVDALGFKGASAFAQTERREDTEIVSYLNFFSYAFIGNFLVLSADAATVRHVVDSYLKHETLASDSNFRNFTRWQPRPTHGQLYISPALMESYKGWAEQTKQVSEQTRAFLTRLTSAAQPITYSLSNEGLGPLHEVHLPKNLVLMAVAGISGEVNPSPEVQKETRARSAMYVIAFAQERYKKGKGAGNYGTLDQLIAANEFHKDMLETTGYKVDVIVAGDKFEVFATPLEYGKTGTLSMYIDQTRVLRGADRGGAPANSSDPPIQ